MTTLLVVDDDPDIRAGIAEVLRDEGFRVLEAADGRDALAILRAGARPDAIILDLMMPRLDGFGFRAAQLEDAALAGIPVLVVSAHGRGPPATAHLAKPFDVAALLRAVERLVGGAPDAGHAP